MTTKSEIQTIRAIDQLEIDIDRAKKAPPFRKLEFAQCALDSAVAVLRALSDRVAALEKDLNE